MNALRFRLAGFPVEVQPNALLLAAIYFLYGLSYGWTFPFIFASIVVAFVSVLFHELGHALTARAFGLGPIGITLHGFGGLTHHQPTGSALRHLVVVLAGPTFGFVLAGLGFATLLLAPSALPGIARDVLEQVVFLNVLWSVFNLLPIFPLDGGQALSATLHLVIAPSLAATLTFGVGLVGAVGLGLYAFTQGYIMMLFFAGTFAWQNFELLQARRRAPAGRR